MLKLLISFFIGFSLACSVAWQACPATIDADGILREPFAFDSSGCLEHVGAGMRGCSAADQETLQMLNPS